MYDGYNPFRHTEDIEHSVLRAAEFDWKFRTKLMIQRCTISGNSGKQGSKGGNGGAPGKGGNPGQIHIVGLSKQQKINNSTDKGTFSSIQGRITYMYKKERRII